MTRMTFALLLAALVLHASASFTASAEEIIVTQKDGKKQKGDLISQDFDTVVIRVSMGGTNKMDVKIPWKEIEELSNGMTYELVQKKWREANKDRLCDVCLGARKVTCATCNGSGMLPKNLADCKTCAGTGLIACAAKGCKDGKVDCPNKCLKLSEGVWKKGREDLLWRTFTWPGGAYEWSERHLGEVIEMKDGKAENVGKCPVCGGTTKVECKECKGQGKVTCPACKGEKKVPVGVAPKCPDCQGGKRDCAACKGTGLKAEVPKDDSKK